MMKKYIAIDARIANFDVLKYKSENKIVKNLMAQCLSFKEKKSELFAFLWGY
jgi:hypothetical protein